MLKIITNLLDSLFPPRSTELLVRKTTAEEMRSLLNPNYYEGCLYLSSYKSPLMKALIQENKYHQNKRAAVFLAHLLEQWLTGLPTEHIVLIPIPQSQKRFRERGHNQVTTILTKLSETKRITIETSLLKKTTHTDTQTNLNKSERFKNIRNTFSCSSQPLAIPKGATVIIVDDVVTTAATLRAAQAVLQPNLPPHVTLKMVALTH